MSKVLAALATVVLLAGLLTSGALAASPGTSPGHGPVTAALGQGPTHWHRNGAYGTWGHVAPRPKSGPRSGATLLAVDNLVNPGNNEIMPTTHTHLIFWLPAGFHYSGGTTAATDLDYENQITAYFNDIGGSQILNTVTQYPGKNGTPADTSDLASSVVDTTAYPHMGTAADPVTQSDLNSQVATHVTAKGMSDMYFIFLPNNLIDCDHAPSPTANCNSNSYCAYHTYGFFGSDTPANDFIWSNIPDNRSVAAIGGCGNSNVTGNNSADTTLSSVEHEHLEAITDPRLNAWQDSTGGGGENGDKCNRNMGVANSSSTTANNYLGVGNADLFRIQREWSNAAGGGGCAASYTTTGSFVESPTPTGSDVTKTVLESSIAGNPADLLHYTVTFKNPSVQDDAFNIVVTDTLPAGVTGPTMISLGDLAPQQTKTVSFTAHPSGPLAAGTTLTNTATFNFDDSTGAAQPSIVRTTTTTVVNAPPVLTVPGPQAQDYHDLLTFGVSATDSDAGDTLSFSASGLPAGLALTDNGDRTATVSGTITAAPGAYSATITVTDSHNTPVSDTVTITVNHEETTTTYTGPTVIANGSPVTLTATVLEDGTTAPSPLGQTVTLGVGSQSCTGLTTIGGNVSCTIPNVTAALGPQPLTAIFAGDTYYLGSSDLTKQAIVFAFPSRGEYAIGDITSASATPSTVVSFWASDWYARNQLSGGTAPSHFKGFTATLSSSPPVCGGTWTTRSGNSPPPPDGPLPSYMGVLVTSSVTESGSTIKGNIVHIVVVTTNPGYAPGPGHTGTGKIVGTYC